MEESKLKFKKIGIDVRVSKMAEISRPELVELGNHIAIDMCVYISVSAIIGDYIHIAPQVSIIGGASALLIMEDFTAIATGSRIICASEDFKKGLLSPFIPLKYRYVINKPIIFEKYSGIGANSVIMPGVRLAIGSVLGAGSVLTHNTEPWTIYAGIPARAVGVRDSELILKGAKELGYE